MAKHAQLGREGAQVIVAQLLHMSSLSSTRRQMHACLPDLVLTAVCLRAECII